MQFIFLVLVASLVQVACSSSSVANPGKIKLINSETLPGNLLPQFMFMMGAIEGGSVGVKLGGGRGTPHPFVPDDSCGDDIFDGAMEDMRSPQLPYLTQDLWTCDRTPDVELDVWVLENEELKVTVTPQFSGKVYSIFDKVKNKELLYANRAHQPANIGALKAWAAGGAEWNWSPGIVGHSAFSESQVHMAKLETERGTVLRVYEFDRYNGTVWQVDMALGNGSFLAHPKITNPTDVDLRGYWWTCVAVPAKPSTRIITPATQVAETSRDPMRLAPWPFFAEAIENASFKGYQDAWPTDNSFLGNHQIGDMFLRIPDTVYTPYIAHTEADGYVLVHGHPLNGTKFYTWGQSGPGRFMQDFLAAGRTPDRSGDYTELQVGPAPTQMQNFPVPARSEQQWTEWFKAFQADGPTVHAAPYPAAVAAVDSWIQSEEGMPKEAVKDWDSFFSKLATATPDEAQVVVQGSPWGALEELLLGRQLAPGLRFLLPKEGTAAFREAQPWLDLVRTGTFSADSLSRTPLSYQTTDRWLAALEKSFAALEEQKSGGEGQGPTWLHYLHRAVAHIERGAVQQPTEWLLRSMELHAHPISARCLAVLQQTPEDAWVWYEKAWALLPALGGSEPDVYARLGANLVTEMSFFLVQYSAQDASWWDQVASFETQVPVQFRGLDAFLLLSVKLALHRGAYPQAIGVLGKECFPTFAKARDDLMNMWNIAQEGLAQQAKDQQRRSQGLPSASLSNVERHQARVQHPVPDNIGCQYASEYCLNYW